MHGGSLLIELRSRSRGANFEHNNHTRLEKRALYYRAQTSGDAGEALAKSIQHVCHHFPWRQQATTRATASRIQEVGPTLIDWRRDARYRAEILSSETTG